MFGVCVRSSWCCVWMCKNNGNMFFNRSCQILFCICPQFVRDEVRSLATSLVIYLFCVRRTPLEKQSTQSRLIFISQTSPLAVSMIFLSNDDLILRRKLYMIDILFQYFLPKYLLNNYSWHCPTLEHFRNKCLYIPKIAILQQLVVILS